MKEDKELPHGRETEVSKLSVDFIQGTDDTDLQF